QQTALFVERQDLARDSAALRRFASPDLHFVAIDDGAGAWSRVERAHEPANRCCALAPIDARLALVDLFRVTDVPRVLRRRVRTPASRDGVERPKADAATERRQPIVQGSGGIVLEYRDTLLEQHRAGVQTGVHLHDGNSGFSIARENRALNRR